MERNLDHVAALGAHLMEFQNWSESDKKALLDDISAFLCEVEKDPLYNEFTIDLPEPVPAMRPVGEEESRGAAPRRMAVGEER